MWNIQSNTKIKYLSSIYTLIIFSEIYIYIYVPEENKIKIREFPKLTSCKLLTQYRFSIIQ